MDEDIMSFILDELDGIRANRNRNLLNQLGEDFEPIQFFELEQIRLRNLALTEDRDDPASQLIPFVVLGEESAEYEEIGFGVWNLNLN